MAEPTDKQIEWAARLLCAVWGEEWLDDDKAAQTSMLRDGRRLLAELNRQGLKVCAEDPTADMEHKGADLLDNSAWHIMHDAAPICPDAE